MTDAATPRVTGLGGVFFRCDDPTATRAWYARHLGVAVDDYGATFAQVANAQSVWSPFKAGSDYFPATQSFMINFIVNDLDGLLARLAADGIACIGTPVSESYGKFSWILDCDGRKIELWQPAVPL